MYDTKIQQPQSSEGDIFAAWVLYVVVVLGLVGYSVVSVFA